MKVLHVESGRHLYGGALQVIFLLRGLAAAGVDSVLACPAESDVEKMALRNGFRIRPLPMGGDGDLALIPRLVRLIRAERPDLVHLHSRRGADVLGGIAARLAGVPAVLSRRVDNPEPRWRAAAKYRLYHRVVTISEGIRRVLLAEGLAPEKVVCVPSAVDTDLYRPGGDPDWFRGEFGLASDERAVAMIAQFIPRKGHRSLVEAAPAILARHPRTRFLLFGRGPERKPIEALLAERGLAEQFLFAGFRDDLPRVLPNLALVVHPARMEGLGVALLQAAACGVPVVACRAGGIPEAVRDGENGLLVAPGDTGALAAAVNRLLDDPALARRYGAAGRVLVERAFSIEAMVRGNLAVYESVRREE